MKSLAVVLLLAVSSVAQSAPTVAQLVGTWKLVSIEDTLTNGTVGPSAQLGPHPRGFIMYEPDGYMCATIVNADCLLRELRTRQFKLDRDTPPRGGMDTFIRWLDTDTSVQARGQPTRHYGDEGIYRSLNREARVGVAEGELNK